MHTNDCNKFLFSDQFRFAELSFTLKKVKPSACEDQNISGMQEEVNKHSFISNISEEIDEYDNYLVPRAKC